MRASTCNAGWLCFAGYVVVCKAETVGALCASIKVDVSVELQACPRQEKAIQCCFGRGVSCERGPWMNVAFLPIVLTLRYSQGRMVG